MNTGDGVTYTAAELIKPNKGCGPFCLFSTLDDVKNYLSIMKIKDMCQIWLCMYEASESLKVWIPTSNDTIHACPLEVLPKNTILADRVRLVFEVEV